MKTVDQVLFTASLLVQRGWTPLFYAADNHGRPVHPGDKSARWWCAFGAIEHAVGGMSECPIEYLPVIREAKRLFTQAIRCADVDAWERSPGRSATQVIDAFVHAMQLAKKRSTNHAGLSSAGGRVAATEPQGAAV